MSDRPTSAPVTVGFLTVLQEPTGWLGGYLVTNAWGRPLEFRLTTAVQPNKVQAALYGPTLLEYLHADLIGKTLVEKTTARPDLIVTDSPPALGLASRVGIPTVALCPNQLKSPNEKFKDEDVDVRGCSPLNFSFGTLNCSAPFVHPRSAVPLVASDEAEAGRLLDAIDAAVDLAEPFARIREAVTEARKMGVTNRAAA